MKLSTDGFAEISRAIYPCLIRIAIFFLGLVILLRFAACAFGRGTAAVYSGWV